MAQTETPHGCGQQEKIGQIEGTIKVMADIAVRGEAREERVVAALEKVAEQGGVLQGVKEHLEKHDKNFNLLFAQERRKPLTIRVLEHRVLGWVVLGSIVVGAICDVIYHRDTVVALMTMAKGVTP